MTEGAENVFWADRLAKEILARKKYRYVDRAIPGLKEYTVKTSASLSGVLHIGRLSDTIRGESVFRALGDAGVKARFIWVAEDMDPLRKVPKGVPAKYADCVGMPVTDVPDPDGCHKSYADHHRDAYLEVIGRFVGSPMRKFSMRDEYRKGTFRPYVKRIMENVELVKEIQNRYRSSPVPGGWSPWMPICGNCGKIITPRIERLEGGKVYYKCQDYKFEKTVARGCGHEGTADPLKDEGKLVWKSEWASQWAHWRVVSEGAGKEYQVPMSAWWVNAEIAERVLGFPMPVPIFYEHLVIGGKKMSASLGNVVYPKDWLEVAEPELLKLFYNKRLMKTRSFSFGDLPKLYDDYDRHARVYFGQEKTGNKKEEAHMKRLYLFSQLGEPEKPNPVPFDFAVMLSQTSQDRGSVGSVLEQTGHVRSEAGKGGMKRVMERIGLAGKWVGKHAPEMSCRLVEKVPEKTKSKLTKKQKDSLKDLAKELGKSVDEKALHNAFWEISKKHGLKPGEFFRACYLVLLGKEAGPRLAPFVLASGRERVRKLLSQV
jgi:lysyl-tRNA synthetase class 1